MKNAATTDASELQRRRLSAPRLLDSDVSSAPSIAVLKSTKTMPPDFGKLAN